MSLPNPDMDFDAFATLPAAELDKIVENVEALAAGTGLNDNAIATAKLADESVTSRKLAPTIISEVCSGATTINSGSDTDITGCTITLTPDIASVAKVTAIVSFASGSTANDLFNVELDVDGTDETELVRFRVPTSGGGGTFSQVWQVPLSAASHTLKLQGHRASGSGSVSVEVTHTKIMVELYGDAHVTDS